MRRFGLILFTFTAILHVPVTLALREVLLRAGAPFPGWLAVAIAALLTLLFGGRMQLVAFDRHIGAPRRLLVEEPYFIHWCAAFAALPLTLAGGLIAAIASPFLPAPSRPSVGVIAAAAYAIGLALAFWGVVVRRRWVRVRTLDVPIAGLAPAYDGYRIAHMSDLHVGSLCPRERVDAWVRRVNELDVDLVALTGDYVTSGVEFHRDIAGALGDLRARDGVVAVMGNHDYFGDGEPLIALLRGRRVTVLRNESTALVRGDERLQIAGVDDTWTRRADIRKALSGRDEDAPIIVLAHDPALFPELARRGASLVLSGHTHWGQIAMPFMSTRWNLSTRAYRYNANLYREGSSTLYVSPGLGTTGPPVRLGAAPEITVLRLRAASIDPSANQ